MQSAATAAAGTSASGSAEGATDTKADALYPGTAVQRMLAVRHRVRGLTAAQLSADWADVRRSLLWAGGLRDLPRARPGDGYTGHCFADYNHTDLTCMLGEFSRNENEGKVSGIAHGNPLGTGIKIASLEELGPGGSWTTCMNGCNSAPPRDVAHVQFEARIAFKLVWCPPDFTRFVLVDDEGALLATGRPGGALPAPIERRSNFELVAGSKYAVEAEAAAGGAP